MRKVLFTLFTGFCFSIFPQLLQAADTTWKDFRLTPENTSLTFLVGSTAHDIHGEALDFQGVIRIPEDMKADKYYTSISIPVNSLVTGMENRDEKMHNFAMEGAKFPEIIFTSTKFKDLPEQLVPGKDFNFTLMGVLTIKGISKQVVLPTRVRNKDGHFVATSSLNLNWGFFNIIDPKFLFFRIHKSFEIQLQVNLPYKVLEEKGKTDESAMIQQIASKASKVSTEEFSGSCMLIPDNFNPKQLKKAAQKAGLSWDWGCKSIFHIIDNQELVRLSNLKRIFGRNLINVEFRCVRDLEPKDAPWSCKEIKDIKKE